MSPATRAHRTTPAPEPPAAAILDAAAAIDLQLLNNSDEVTLTRDQAHTIATHLANPPQWPQNAANQPTHTNPHPNPENPAERNLASLSANQQATRSPANE